MDSFGIISVSIQSQNIRLLEYLTIDRDCRASRLQSLKKAAGLDELVYLATCNRVEFIFTKSGYSDGGRMVRDIRNSIIDFFFRSHRDMAFDPKDFNVMCGIEAVGHLFNVAAALDSLVVGEAQILGQLKEAYAFAVENDLAGNELTKMFTHAFKVGKRVRTETELGKKSVSMISLVTSDIEKIIRSEGQVQIALVGAGDMTRKLAKFLIDRKVKNILFVNRTPEKAFDLARHYGGQAMPLDTFLSFPPQARIVCSATSSPEPIFTDEAIAKLLSVNEKVLFVDLAVPRDVAIENSLENGAEIRNISDLRQIANDNRRQRFRDVDQARSIVTEEMIRYHKGIIIEELRPIFASSLKETREFADKGLRRLFETRLSHLDRADQATLNHWIEKLISAAAFLPARALADKIVAQASVVDDSGNEKAESGKYVRALRKGA